MNKPLLALLLLLAPLKAWADPFIFSGSWSTNKPTHCYLYVDGGATPVKSAVGVNGDSSVYCRADVASLTVGSHTLELSGAIESGGVLQAESPKTTVGTMIKEACSDPKLCIYRYQLKETVVWYK